METPELNALEEMDRKGAREESEDQEEADPLEDLQGFGIPARGGNAGDVVVEEWVFVVVVLVGRGGVGDFVGEAAAGFEAVEGGGAAAEGGGACDGVCIGVGVVVVFQERVCWISTVVPVGGGGGGGSGDDGGGLDVDDEVFVVHGGGMETRVLEVQLDFDACIYIYIWLG